MDGIKTYDVTFSKVSNNHNRLRDDIIEGSTNSLPVVGSAFVMFAPPRDSGNVRMVNTSVVVKIINSINDVVKFETASGSIYIVALKN